MELNKGTLLLNYKLLQPIGEGGMGEVWLAEDTALERKVAIKILAPEYTRNLDLIARFRQEAKLQASLIHKNIVTLHTFFEEQGQYFMVMEYAQGITIKQLIQQIGPIPEARVINILNQVFDALSYAHEKGIIHRDIKPSNIMINPDKCDYVKIMDFGIAKALGDKGLTHTGTRLGTLYYMSPEQIRAEKDIDQRSDIYSLGITIFEMLTGNLPFDTDTESDYHIQHQIVTNDVPDPRINNPYISDVFVAVIYMMTQKDKEHRYARIDEISLAFKEEQTSYAHVSNIPPNYEKDYVHTEKQHDERSENKHNAESKPTSKKRKNSVVILGVIFITIIIMGIVLLKPNNAREVEEVVDTTMVAPIGTDYESVDNGEEVIQQDVIKDNVSDDTDEKRVISNWTDGLNNRDLSSLHNLYAENVHYYGKYLTPDEIVSIQRKLLEKYDDFNQAIVSDITSQTTSNGDIRLDFTKRVFYNSQTDDYPSYLIIRKYDNGFKIVTESDLVTDRNLSKNK